MQRPVNNKRPEIRVRYTAEEFARLKKAFIKTTCGTIGSYARKMSLGEPIEVISRNGSFDAFVEEIVLLRIEMAAIRKNDRLTTENQQILVRLHQQIQQTIDKIARLCMHP
jgi:hypothetical protein